MSKDSGTRSGMLWEVERILDECNELGTLPNLLLMENVPQVIGSNAIKDFQSWRGKLESLGYSNYVECLNAKDYGVPQSRNRCFMVSVLGDYSYTFPKKKLLEKKLKDILENNVDESYYITHNMKKYICSRMPTGEHKFNVGIHIHNVEEDAVAGTLCTSGGNQANDTFVMDNTDIIYDKKIGYFRKLFAIYLWRRKRKN